MSDPFHVRVLNQSTRWASWERDVLAKVAAPEACQQAIRHRQAELNDDQTEADEVAAHFRSQLARRGHDPNTDCVFIRSAVACKWLMAATGRRFFTNTATAHLKGLGIQQLTPTKKDGVPGWRWTGDKLLAAGTLRSMVHLQKVPGAAATDATNSGSAGQIPATSGQV